ncbi:DUF2628 domain-containing protein [Pseudacidovorax intermedius]|uniref:DUF2628 domain-containing protein n=1 Tax=Pseudacidovorax intermedius TaxID=433924 RepID=UPI0026EA0E71|nr:DUF2628 domain-containing protein [Pseudacidovorax intermedius]
MRTYNVYTHPTHGLEAVKVGFSWPAFFFGLFWMLFKKLWRRAGLWFAVYLVLALIENVIDRAPESGTQALVYLLLSAGYFVLWLLPAFKGNAWRDADLVRRGYDRLATLEADTADAALAHAARPV